MILSDEARLVNMIQRRLRLISGTIVRPVVNSSDSVEVQFAMTLHQILGVNDKSQVITVKVWKQMVCSVIPFLA